MVFDLRRALLAKEERESARLEDFAFRVRIRAWRLLAAELGVEADALVRRAARMADAALLAELGTEVGATDVAGLFARCEAEARRALVAERGDPGPLRLG